MLEKTEGIVLNSIKYGDSSKIIQVYTRNFGKISLIAKGAYNPKSKFGSSLEPSTHSLFTFYYKNNLDLFLLSNAEVIKSYTKLSQNQENLIYALMILESIYLTQENKVRNDNLFETTLFSLNNFSENNNPFNIFCYFMYELSIQLGFYLYIENKLNQDSNYVINYSNGLIHKWNNDNLKNQFKINFNEYSYLLKIIKEKDFAIKINKETETRLYEFWINYFSFHLEHKFYLKSYSFLC